MRPRRGFTLLEMLLATALSALLIVGVMGVVTSMTRANTASSADAADASRPGRDPFALRSDAQALDDWAAMLGEELEQAEAIELHDRDGLAMLTYAALEPGGADRTHRPSVVRYAVVERDGLAVLIRQQAMLDDVDGGGARRAVVALGVRRFALIPPPARQLREAMAEGRTRGGSVGSRGSDGAADDTPPLETGHRWIALGEDDDPHYFRGVTLRTARDVGASGADAESESEPAAATYASSAAAAEVDAGRWRLRVWMNGQTDPTLDRALTLE